MTMEKTYQPHAIEATQYKHWEESHAFAPTGRGKPFCMVIPPPNVTGSLHMGHGFQYSLMDALTRYHRMMGDNTLWQVGTDHAGIATQMVVERLLQAEGISRHDLGREAFLEKIWAWKAQSGSMITNQMRRLGASVDWSRERFTMDASLSQAVQKVFIKLFNDGLIYRGKRLVNWDPQLLTAISDLEVVSEEEDGYLWHIRYPLADGSGSLVVATTRPETLLGDVAVAVHPDDSRYQSLIGKHVRLPLTDRLIPIIADSEVLMDFGTGCVKITPAHDFNDYAMGQRHQLSPINILTPTAHLNDQVPVAYQGLERFKAREQVLADLTAQGLLVDKIKHKLKIPRGDRSGVIVEPYLTDQWFIHMKPLAEPAIAAVKQGQIKFVPENWDKTYFQWLENIEDWCISRQLWWGHRIPAWYDEKGQYYVGENEAAVRAQHQLDDSIKLHQDEDVLDTWFSSALWPFSALGWPEEHSDVKTFYPTQVLVTGFDIIFFWVARMIMFGLKFTGKVPFDTVYITGLIRDHDGQKMSKSKGNIIDPIDLIDGISLDDLITKRTTGLMQPKMAEAIKKATIKQFPEGIPSFGTDAVRMTFYSLSGMPRDVRFDLARLEGYRNFCNKLWNAARFALMHTETEGTIKLDKSQLSTASQWIWHQLQQTISAVHKHLQAFRFDFAAQAIYEFIWYEYCDWYVEFAKTELTGAKAQSTKATLVHVLETALRLLHPFMPFITASIWSRVAPLAGYMQTDILHTDYPRFDETLCYPQAHIEMAWTKDIILAVRNIRGEMNINPGKTLTVFCRGQDASYATYLQHQHDLICRLAKLSDLTWIEPQTEVPAAATNIVGDVEVLIPLAGAIDVAAEQARLSKEIAKLQVELNKCQQKLMNPSFVDKAPPAVVLQEQGRVNEFSQAIKLLTEQLHAISPA